jgi:hypothetical protein
MNIKRILKRLVRNIASQSVGFKIMVAASVIVVSVSAFTIPKLFDQTHSAYESHAIVDSKTKNALFDMEVISLTGVQLSNISGYASGSTLTVANVADGPSLGKTTIKDGTSTFGTLLNIDKLEPGDVFAFGYKCVDVGNIPMTLLLDLKSTFTPPTEAATLTYLGKDPRARFDLQIYESDTVNGAYSKISNGVLDLSMYDTKGAVPLLPNTRDLDPAQGKYYIVVIQFTNPGTVWTSNTAGDNIYQLSETGIDLTIKANQKD